MTQIDFGDLSRRAVSASGHDGMDIVEKEILHYDILHAMVKSGFLDDLVFHGGTALRLCHGGDRLSEDLDFCAVAGFPIGRAAALATEVQRYVGNRYGLRVRVSEPRARAHDGIRVHRWWIRVETEPERPDLRWQRIKLEIADVPTRTSEARSLARNYNVIPAGYENTVIRVETREGILADKLIAFPVSLPSYVRWRDIWDMRWLRNRGVVADAGLVRTKLGYYRVENFDGLLAAAIRKIPTLVRSEGLTEKLRAFMLPDMARQTIRNEAWLEAASNELREMLADLQRDLALPVDKTGDRNNDDACAPPSPFD